MFVLYIFYGKGESLKKLLVSLTALIMIFTLVACNSGQGNTASADEEENRTPVEEETKPEESSAAWPAMDALQSLSVADITTVEYVRATEGGISADQIDDAATIEDIYLRLKDVNIKDESKMGVDDDGLDIKITTDDTTLRFNFEGDILLLEEGSRYEVENLHMLKNYIDSLIAENNAAGDNSSSEALDSSAAAGAVSDASKDGGTPSSSSGASDSYDVSEGFETVAPGDGIDYLYFNDFMLVMPDNEKYSFDMEGDSVTFYLFSAQQEGYGGRLVTIKAFDLDDTSYEEYPMEVHVAGVGQNVNKKFVAIYPSDLQYNPQDSQQAADYKDLFDHLHKIGEGAVNSPLQTSNSD